MSWISSIWMKDCFEARTRVATAAVMSIAGVESRWSERKDLRTAISTFWSMKGTTWLLRRMTRTPLMAWGAGGGEFAGAVQEQALRDVVGVVIDEGLLDELIEIVEGNAQGGLAQGGGGEISGDLADNAGHEGAGLERKDGGGLAAGKVDVGEGLAEGVGDLAEVERRLPLGREECDLR